MPRHPLTVIAASGMLAVGIGCTREPAAKAVPAAPAAAAKATAVMAACSLLTTDEANAVLKLKAVAAMPIKDSAQAALAASRGESRCVFGPPPGQGIGEVVTVYDRNGMKPMDQSALNAYATTLGLGEQAQTLTGLGVTASVMKEMPTVVAIKGEYVVLVSAPTMDGTKSLAAKALARLP